MPSTLAVFFIVAHGETAALPPFHDAGDYPRYWKTWPVCMALDLNHAWTIWNKLVEQVNDIIPNDQQPHDRDFWIAALARHESLIDPLLRAFLLPDEPHVPEGSHAGSGVSYSLYRVWDDPTRPADDITGDVDLALGRKTLSEDGPL